MDLGWPSRELLLILASAQTSNAPVTANMDSGTANGSPKHFWYEQGFNLMKPQTGLLLAGTPFQSQANSDHWYRLHRTRILAPTRKNRGVGGRSVPRNAKLMDLVELRS